MKTMEKIKKLLEEMNVEYEYKEYDDYKSYIYFQATLEHWKTKEKSGTFHFEFWINLSDYYVIYYNNEQEHIKNFDFDEGLYYFITDELLADHDIIQYKEDLKIAL